MTCFEDVHVAWIKSHFNFDTLVSQFEVILGYLDNESNWTMGTLCAQLLLQFYADSSETSQMS